MTDHLSAEDLAEIRNRHVIDFGTAIGDRDVLLTEVDRLRASLDRVWKLVEDLERKPDPCVEECGFCGHVNYCEARQPTVKVVGATDIRRALDGTP